MKLPNHENAFIPPDKLTGYLLSETHAVGKAKAQFFRAHGFHDENVEQLEKGLLTIARTKEIEEEKTSLHGTKYLVSGTLEMPKGRLVTVRTVWIIESGQERPRLVTAYPA